MGINLRTETIVTLNQAARLVPSAREGRPVHVSSLVRAITKGVRGHRLEALRWGGRWITSIEACQRWAERLTESPSSDGVHSSKSARCKELERVEQALEALGL